MDPLSGMDDETIYASETIYAKHGPVFLLWACRETGVIEALLDGRSDPAAVAEETEISRRAAEIVLDALAALGYAETRDGECRPTERLEAFDPETPITERGMLPHRVDSFGLYTNLPTAMQTGERPDFTEEGLRNYVAGMGTIDERVVRAGVTAAERVHPRPERVVDVGGGIGRFGREFAARGADVTLVDNPGVIDIVRPHLEESDLELVAGDALESLPGGFDLAFCGRLTEGFSPEENEQLFEVVHDALEPGGTIACMDYVRGRSGVAELFAVHMLAMSDTGNTYTEDQYRSWLEGAGFVEPEVRDVPGTDFQVTTARKPD